MMSPDGTSNDKDGSERRRFDREPVRLKVEYPDAQNLVHDYTLNISRGGTFILTQRNLPLGTAVKITLSFPGLLAPITLQGTVRWVRESQSPDERGVGVEFDLREEGLQGKIDEIVDRIKRADPELLRRTLRVLIVEDNPHVVELLKDGIGFTASREFAGRVKFEFLHVRHGLEALDLLAAKPFDLIITDIYMPVMDGAVLIKSVRSDPRFAQIPIIAVSGGGQGAHEMAQVAGANVFIEKPMRLQDVLNTVRRLVRI